jgi:hypothetical protein
MPAETEILVKATISAPLGVKRRYSAVLHAVVTIFAPRAVGERAVVYAMIFA